jgi:hypothetical protein
MIKAKLEIKNALKHTHLVLQDQRAAQKVHFHLKPALPISVLVKPFIKEFVQIDIQNKPQPAIIRVLANGLKEKDVILYFSTGERHPDERTCQNMFKHQSKIEFYMKDGNEDAKDLEKLKFRK